MRESLSGMPRIADVLVIGGGPGGSTAATMLAQKGFRVVLMERERFPRDHIGESLLPASMPFLEWLGVLPAIQAAGFYEKWGATMVWGKERSPWSWYFRETNPRYPHAYQVWRPQFDQLLLENSRAHGVDVREGHRVLDVLFEGERAVGVRYRADGASEQVARAEFIVDASGQSALLGHKLQLRRWDAFFRNMAVYGYFEGAERLPPPDETNILVESYPQGWFWNIPLHKGWMSVGAVVDSVRGQEALRQKGPEQFLREQVREAPYTAKLLREARLVYGPFVLKDWSYLSDEVVGDGYILVGDAACFIDPLFSSGVHLAILAGALAAAYVTTVLQSSDEELKAASARFYKEQYYQEYHQFRTMAQLFYSSNRTVEGYFWEARRLLGERDDLTPRQAFIKAVAGRPQRGYERVVLEKGEPPEEFVRSVRAVESERAQRLARLKAVEESSFYAAVPRLAEGVAVRRQPEIKDGAFVWGYALMEPGAPLGTPCSGVVAAAAALMDGRRTVREIVARLQMGRDEALGVQIERAAVAAVQALYVEGLVAELAGLPE